MLARTLYHPRFGEDITSSLCPRKPLGALELQGDQGVLPFIPYNEIEALARNKRSTKGENKSMSGQVPKTARDRS